MTLFSCSNCSSLGALLDVPLTYSHQWVFFYFFELPYFVGLQNATGSSYTFLVPESAIYPGFWLENDNKSQVLAARCAPCYQDALAFGSSQLTKQRNICVCVLVHVSINISILIFCIYIKLNTNLIKCFQFLSINTWVILPSFLCFSLYIFISWTFVF